MKQELRPYLMLHGQFTHHFEHGRLSLCEDRVQGLCSLGHLGCTVCGFTLFSLQCETCELMHCVARGGVLSLERVAAQTAVQRAAAADHAHKVG